MKCAIIDDEFLARELIQSHLSKILGIELVGKFSNPLEALPLISKGEIDLIFLDIQMPEITGIDFIKTLKNKPYIVLTTAYSEYALQAFDLDVMDYLVKPISFTRFLQAINKIEAMHSNASPNSGIGNAAPVQKDHLILRTNQKTVKLDLKNLLMVEGQKEYVCYYTMDEQHVVLESLKSIEEKLPTETFMRVHKSYIVSMPAIKFLDGNELTIEGGFRVPIGPSYRDLFLERFR